MRSMIHSVIQLIVGLHPQDGPKAVIRVDPGPGFSSLTNRASLEHFNVTVGPKTQTKTS